jgi:uncharacterized protein YhaN
MEQLYLAIRFGYVENSRAGGETLPIIMDDILVNADPGRARASARAIVEISRTHQVLFFTCHPQTVELFREDVPDVAVVTIHDGKILRAAAAAE